MYPSQGHARWTYSPRLVWRGSITVLLLAALQSLQCLRAVTLEWNASPDPDVAGYRLYYADETGLQIVSDVGNHTQASVTDLVPGRTYRFYVTAYHSSGLEGLPSNDVGYTETLYAANLRQAWINDAEALLTWTDF